MCIFVIARQWRSHNEAIHKIDCHDFACAKSRNDKISLSLARVATPLKAPPFAERAFAWANASQPVGLGLVKSLRENAILLKVAF
ncbi:hypothetical protein [Helicobacter sp. T3_23-1059]